MKRQTRWLIWTVALLTLGPMIHVAAANVTTIGQWLILTSITAVIATWLSKLIAHE